MRTLKFLSILFLIGCGGSTASVTPLPECYNTFSASVHTCTSDYSGINITTTTTADQPSTTTEQCQCPKQTACFDIGDGLVACALTEGN